MHTTTFYFLVTLYSFFLPTNSGEPDKFLRASQDRCGSIVVEKLNKLHHNENKFPICSQKYLTDRRPGAKLFQVIAADKQKNNGFVDADHQKAWYQMKEIYGGKDSLIGNPVYGQQECATKIIQKNSSSRQIRAFYIGRDTLAFKGYMASMKRNAETGWMLTAQVFDTLASSAAFYSVLRTIPDSACAFIVIDGTNAVSNDSIEQIVVHDRRVRRLLFIDVEHSESSKELLGGGSYPDEFGLFDQKRLMYIHTANPENTAINILKQLKGNDWHLVGAKLQQDDKLLEYRLGYFE